MDAEEGGPFECRPGVPLNADPGVPKNADGGSLTLPVYKRGGEQALVVLVVQHSSGPHHEQPRTVTGAFTDRGQESAGRRRGLRVRHRDVIQSEASDPSRNTSTSPIPLIAASSAPPVRPWSRQCQTRNVCSSRWRLCRPSWQNLPGRSRPSRPPRRPRLPPARYRPRRRRAGRLPVVFVRLAGQGPGADREGSVRISRTVQHFV